MAPHLRSVRGDEPIASRTALLVCIRHEDPQRLQRNLAWMLDGLVASGAAGWFHLYLLSDSTEPASDRSMLTRVALACLVMLVSASCAVR